MCDRAAEGLLPWCVYRATRLASGAAGENLGLATHVRSTPLFFQLSSWALGLILAFGLALAVGR
jgi:hypothetical protein